ncbi:MAG: BrnT family toxin [Gemmatimonadetes bacterium]|nr:BrnT family toxin [Gemmatimonadota bacterium]
MDIRWDPPKARANFAKHGVAFSDAEPVLFDPYGVTTEDDRVDEEQRFVTIGLDAVGRILVVVYTYRQETIRLISARRATQAEQRNYEEGIRLQ